MRQHGDRPRGPFRVERTASDDGRKVYHLFQVFWDSDPYDRGVVSVTVTGSDASHSLMENHVTAHVMYYQNVAYQFSNTVRIQQGDTTIIIEKEG